MSRLLIHNIGYVHVGNFRWIKYIVLMHWLSVTSDKYHLIVMSRSTIQKNLFTQPTRTSCIHWEAHQVGMYLKKPALALFNHQWQSVSLADQRWKGFYRNVKKLRQLGAVDVSNMAITGRHAVTQFHSTHLSRVVQQNLKNESNESTKDCFMIFLYYLFFRKFSMISFWIL